VLVDVISDFGSVTIERSHFSNSMTSLPFLRASSTVSGPNALTSETKNSVSERMEQSLELDSSVLKSRLS